MHIDIPGCVACKNWYYAVIVHTITGHKSTKQIMQHTVFRIKYEPKKLDSAQQNQMPNVKICMHSGSPAIGHCGTCLSSTLRRYLSPPCIHRWDRHTVFWDDFICRLSLDCGQCSRIHIFQNSKKRQFYTFFASLHTFSRTTIVVS